MQTRQLSNFKAIGQRWSQIKRLRNFTRSGAKTYIVWKPRSLLSSLNSNLRINWHIEARTKRLVFSNGICKGTLWKETFVFWFKFDRSVLQCTNDAVINESALVQVMAWRQAGTKSLPEPVWTKMSDSDRLSGHTRHKFIHTKNRFVWNIKQHFFYIKTFHAATTIQITTYSTLTPPQMITHFNESVPTLIIVNNVTILDVDISHIQRYLLEERNTSISKKTKGCRPFDLSSTSVVCLEAVT